LLKRGSRVNIPFFGPNFTHHLPLMCAAHEQIVLNNTFLSVENTAKVLPCSGAPRRSKSLGDLCCRRAIASCEVREKGGHHALEGQIHRLNQLFCLDRLECLNRFSHELSHEAALVDESKLWRQLEQCQTWTLTASISTHVFTSTCTSNKLHCANSLSEASELAGTASCLYDETHFSKEHAQNWKTLPCTQHADVLCPDLSVPAMCQDFKSCTVESKFTTAMIRNIPYHYTQDQLVQELSDLGFTSMCYDFLYLPCSKGKRSSVGYAFVNFKGPHWVRALKQTLHKHRFNDLDGRCHKTPSVSAAACQGFMNNIARFAQISISNRTCGSPLVEVTGASHRLLFEIV